jgi:hypothetical protein
VGPRAGLDTVVKRKHPIPLPGIESWSCRPHSLVTILTELPRPAKMTINTSELSCFFLLKYLTTNQKLPGVLLERYDLLRTSVAELIS